MRALLIACLALAPSVSLADVPVPVPNPFLAGEREAVETGCPEGSVPSAVALSLVEQHVIRSGQAGAIVAGPMAKTMRSALSVVTGKPVPEVTSIVMMVVPVPEGEPGQLWVLFSGECSPNIAILPPPVVAAVWKQINSSI